MGQLYAEVFVPPWVVNVMWVPGCGPAAVFGKQVIEVMFFKQRWHSLLTYLLNLLGSEPHVVNGLCTNT